MSSNLLLPWIDGRPWNPGAGNQRDLSNPWDGSETCTVQCGGSEAVEKAAASARAAFCKHRTTSTAERIRWLERAAGLLEDRNDELVALAVRDIGKPWRAASFEVQRSCTFIRGCAQTLQSFGGEVLPLDVAPRAAGLFGYTRRQPYGVMLAITPFNAPANLLVQKVAPGLAVGNAVIVKPSLEGSAIALAIAVAFQEAGLPDGLLNVVTGHRDEALALASHAEIDLVSVTGGTAAGDDLARAAGAKRFVAELGGNSANIVCTDADLADAATRIAASAFEASGQQCISAQRVIVQKPVFEPFLEAFAAASDQLRIGDPSSPETDVGPVINAGAAKRIEAAVEEARRGGAQILRSPNRLHCLLAPTIVVEPPLDSRIVCEEIFGPVAVIIPAEDVDYAVEIANQSVYGLQAACFTRSLATAFRVSDALQVGSVWINEGSRFRLDNYPFGGVGQSGFGREGIRYALEEYSQWKFVGIRLPSESA